MSAVSQRTQADRSPRAEILEAAAHQMARLGYHGMSLREIARTTGRALSTFYCHFPSKEALLQALQVESFTELIEGAREAVRTGYDPEARLRAFVLNHVRYLVQHRDRMRVLVHEARALPAEARQEVSTLKRRYFEEARGLVEAVFDAPAEREVVDGATYALFGMLNWPFGWYEEARHGSAETLARIIAGVALGGLRGARTEEIR